MSSEIKKDIDEARRLLQLCIRKNVANVIQAHIEQLEQAHSDALKSEHVEVNSTKETPIAPKVYTSKIETYAWDQTDSFVKIYATNLKGVKSLPPSNITCHFTHCGFNLVVHNLNSKNLQLHVVSLYDKIKPEESKIKVQTDCVLVMLKKAKSIKWEGVTELERKKKEHEKFEKLANKDEDPSASIMTMMKKMYDEGDDEMKRTIAKAWTETQDKKGKSDDY